MIATTGGSPIVTIIVSSVAALWFASGLVDRWQVRRSGSLPGDSTTAGVDPGWRPVFFRMMRMWPQPGPADPPDPLTTMRMILLGLEISSVLVLLVLSFNTPWSNASVRPAPWIAVGAGLLSMIGVAWVRRRPLHAEIESGLAGQLEIESGLAGQFRTALFIGIGFAEIPYLAGVAAALTTKNLWIFVVGLAFSMLGLTLVAPRRAEIARRQRQMVEAHSPHDLTRALLRSEAQGPGPASSLSR